MQPYIQTTSPQALSSKKDQLKTVEQESDHAHPVFVTQKMQNTSIMSWKDNVASEFIPPTSYVYNNPTFMFISPSCSSESNIFLTSDNSISSNIITDTFNQAELNEDLLFDSDMPRGNINQLPLGYQTCISSSSSHQSTDSTSPLLSPKQEGIEDEEHPRGRSRSRSSDTSPKREKTLEKNRQAAFRCRQRKKEWVNQLQVNMEKLTRENRVLEEQSMSLREEILNLKTILLSHRDCSQSSNPDSIDVVNIVYKDR